MTVLYALDSPWLFTAVMTGVLAMLLHIAIRNEGWWPVFRIYRIRRVLLLTLLSWSIAVLFSPLHASPVAASVLHTRH
ncbi:MAG: hypothetical protein WA777_02830 [Rhodanobacter sp.]